MVLSRRQIEATESRYAGRASHREEIYRKLNEGSVVTADDPQIVEKRMERLARSSAATEGLTRAVMPPGPVTEAAPRLIGLALERVLGRSDLFGVNYLELAIQVSRTIGRVQIRNGLGQIEGFGTGFMISPRLLLTNNHVLDSAQTAARSRVEFNYQEALDGTLLATSLFSLDPTAFFVTDEDLDYTIVAVRADGGQREVLGAFGWNQLIEEEGKVIIGEYVNIIQHPNGEPKQLALRENRITDRLEQFLHYHTDTAPGSSGSPVFNDQWEVVALHHSGVPKRDKKGRVLARDGSVWTEEMGEHRIDWVANEGVRISRILRHLRDQGLDEARGRLRNEIFEAASVPAPLGRPTGAGDTRSPEAGAKVPLPSQTAGEAGQDGTAVWTIPLQVTVRLGQPVLQVGTPAAASATAASGEPPAGSAGEPPKEEDAELREALAELEAGLQRPYYDEAKDTLDRNTYYRAEIENGLGNDDVEVDAKAAYGRLRDLLQQTHREQPKYRPRKHLYPWVDLHPNRKVQSIYSGQEFDPEELIQEDFRIDQERVRLSESLREQFHQPRLGESTRSEAQLQEAIALLEATLPYNCEHVVPQSWFAEEEPMRGDLHHLFTCESKCNSFRGNAPYFDFADFGEAVRSECGKKQADRFEPETGKGAVARATLYFLLRYPGEIDRSSREYLDAAIDTLLQWHRENPPTEYEKHRNAAIFEKQGNRNPLIDFPEWADKIDFTQGLG